MTLSKYSFDVVALSETWLTKDKALNDYVQIPGYELVSENCNNMKGGGVGFYIKDSMKFKRRKDIEKKTHELEHLWIELPGKNKNSRLLTGVIYRSEKLLTLNDWLEKFEETIAYVKSTWDGPVLIAGDMNINLMSYEDTKCREYLNMIDQFNLVQMGKTPTRITQSTSSLIDHILISQPSLIKFTDVLPCHGISDHDGPYALTNIRVPRYEPRYKLIRDEKSFDNQSFVRDVNQLPFSLVYSIEDPDEKLSIFNQLLLEGINKYAPSKKIKVTRTPAPWIHDPEIRHLQKIRDECRVEARQTQAVGDSSRNSPPWEKFTESKRAIKKAVRKAKATLYRKALSKQNKKEVCKVIHSVLHPPAKRSTLSPSVLNKYFATVTNKTTKQLNKKAVPIYNIYLNPYLNILQLLPIKQLNN